MHEPKNLQNINSTTASMHTMTQTCRRAVIRSDINHAFSNIYFSNTSNTLNSVGTISLGVSNPINISRPTKHMIDMKMEKSLISFLSYTATKTHKHTHDRGRVNKDIHYDSEERRRMFKSTGKKVRTWGKEGRKWEEKNHYSVKITQNQMIH